MSFATKEKTKRMRRLEVIKHDLNPDNDKILTKEDLILWHEDLGAVSWLPHRKAVLAFYRHPSTQVVVSSLIFLNFFAEVLRREIDPYPSDFQQYPTLWRVLDDCFTVFFIIELLVNWYGTFFLPFFRNAWNMLDLLVVCLGVVSLARVGTVFQLRFLRVIRTFRVVRLFKRLKSMNNIIRALVTAIPGVVSAFMIMLIVMSMYAIVSVDLFREFGNSGEYQSTQIYGVADAQYGESCGIGAVECIDGTKLGGSFTNVTTVTAVTQRGMFYGQEYYGTFSRALYTLLQVLTGESWSEAVVRPLFIGSETSADRFVVGAFFVSYIIVAQVVLQNVVVAVLIEGFAPGSPSEEEEQIARDLEMLHALAMGEDKKQLQAREEIHAQEILARSIDPHVKNLLEQFPLESLQNPEKAPSIQRQLTSNFKIPAGGVSQSVLQKAVLDQPTRPRSPPPLGSKDPTQMMQFLVKEQVAVRSDVEALSKQMAEVLKLLKESSPKSLEA